jgi:V/A-type H+-transporting ATPase subunit C
VTRGYEYGNARLRAKRSQLLKEADYLALLSCEKLEEVIAALIETPYKEDLERALARLGGVQAIFEALRANLTRTLRQIRGFFEGPPQMLIDLLLRRWDRHNLLTILRGQSREVSAEVVLSALIPVGQLDEISLRELARQPGLQAALDLMVTWRLPYSQVLRQVKRQSSSGFELDQLELALNRFHYNSLYQALSQGNGNRAIVLDYLRGEVDLINIRTVFRLAHLPELIPVVQHRYEAATIVSLLIEPGGCLPAKRLAELVAETNGLAGIVQGLKDTRYGKALEAGWQRFQTEAGGLTGIERALERWQAGYVASLFNRDPLSVAIPLAYIGCKEVEVTNLRLIAQAVALNLDRQKLQQDLIIGVS